MKKAQDVHPTPLRFPQLGMVCYEIELEKGEKVREVLYREDGLFIGEEEDL